MAAGQQHHLEYGGSHVTTEFDGRISFDLVARIPVISVSHEFTGQTARQIRYHLVATVGAERPFYHRWPWVVLDVRMISSWEEGAGEFVEALQERLQDLEGDLYLVASAQVPVAPSVRRFATPEEAIAAAREDRAAHRAELLQV